MRRGDRAAVDQRRKRLAVRISEQRLGARGLAIDQPIGSIGVEAQHPVADDLQCHVTQPRGLRASAAIMDRRQCQPTTRLGRTLAPSRQTAKIGGAEIQTQGDARGMAVAPGTNSVNHISAASGNPLLESQAVKFGILPSF